MRTSIRRVARCLPWLAVSLVFTGCAHYSAEPLSPAAMVESLQSRSLDDPSLRAYVAKSTGQGAPPWNVAALQAAAAYLNPQYPVAQAAAEVAREAVAAVGQRPAPSLNVPLEYTTNAKADESPYTAGLGLEFTVETGGKRGYRKAQAAHFADAARFDAQAELWRIRARVRQTLLELWSSRLREAALASEARARADLIRMVDRRVQLGAAAMPELYLARAQWQDAQNRLMSETRRSGESVVAAASAIGLASSRLDPSQLDLSEFSRLPDGLLQQEPDPARITQRADVQAALARYEASQSALQLAVAGQYPDIRLGPGYTFDAGAHKIAFSIAELPLTLFQDHGPAIAQAVARRRQAGARLKQVVAEALGAIEQAQVSLRIARLAFDSAQARLESEEHLLAAVQRALEQGELDRVDLLRAQAARAAAQAEREAAWLEVQKAAGTLELAWRTGPSAVAGESS